MLHSESYNKMKREQNAAYDLNKALKFNVYKNMYMMYL